MESFLVVMQIIALACLSVLSLYLLVVLVRVRSVLSNVEKDLKELSSKAIPVFENLEVITEKMKYIASSIDEQVEMVKTSISSIKEVADNVLSFERRIQARLEEPVLETVSFLAAILKGVRTFFERVRT